MSANELTREDIRHSISFNIRMFLKTKEICYLDNLPTAIDSDYDDSVKEYKNKLYSSCNDRQYFFMLLDELIELYYINQNSYEF